MSEHAAETAHTDEHEGQCDHEIQLFNLKDVQGVKLWRTNQTGPLISQSCIKNSAGSAFLQLGFSQKHQKGAK